MQTPGIGISENVYTVVDCHDDVSLAIVNKLAGNWVGMSIPPVTSLSPNGKMSRESFEFRVELVGVQIARVRQSLAELCAAYPARRRSPHSSTRLPVMLRAQVVGILDTLEGIQDRSLWT